MLNGVEHIGHSANSLAEIFGHVSCLSYYLKKLASEGQLTVVVINNSTTKNGTEIPALGKIFSKTADVRLHIQRDKAPYEQRRNVVNISMQKSLTHQLYGMSCKCQV